MKKKGWFIGIVLVGLWISKGDAAPVGGGAPAGDIAVAKQAYHYFINADRSVAVLPILFDFDVFYTLVAQDFKGSIENDKAERFKALFSEVFFKQLAKKGLRAHPLEDPIYTRSENARGQSKVVLQGKAFSDSQEAVTMTIDFYLREGHRGWRIEDFAVNGALLSRNYRGHFNRIFREEGFSGLVARMEQKLSTP